MKSCGEEWGGCWLVWLSTLKHLPAVSGSFCWTAVMSITWASKVWNCVRIAFKKCVGESQVHRFKILSIHYFHLYIIPIDPPNPPSDGPHSHNGAPSLTCITCFCNACRMIWLKRSMLNYTRKRVEGRCVWCVKKWLFHRNRLWNSLWKKGHRHWQQRCKFVDKLPKTKASQNVVENELLSQLPHSSQQPPTPKCI